MRLCIANRAPSHLLTCLPALAQVDPRLAIALGQWFPGVACIQTALESLVKDHAAENRVQVGWRSILV